MRSLQKISTAAFLLFAATVSLTQFGQQPSFAQNAVKNTVTKSNAYSLSSPGATLLPLELVATSDKYMPRGIFVTDDNRIFVCLPRHEDSVPYTLTELKNGQLQPYPDLPINQFDQTSNPHGFASIMSTRASNNGLLWVLDSGRVSRLQVPHTAKLVAINLATNNIEKVIPLGDDVILKNTFLKDFCLDESKGKSGFAVIADSSPQGDNAFVVVDLETGKAFRRLHKDPSVMSEPDFVIFAEGQMVRFRISDTNKVDMLAGVSGLALSSDKKTLFYSPMASHSFYSVDFDKLCDAEIKDNEVAATIKVLGSKVGASDSVAINDQGDIFITDVENDAIWKRSPNGGATKVAADERLSWPDRLCLSKDGYLYVTASQIHRSPWYHMNKDLRTRPFQIFRIKLKPTDQSSAKAAVSPQ
ncbi:MAG: L-dopachrome tautomerase-related protein [Candidatus Obscuribacterales bacterium]|nr:L-dopachrome tautomerase-related protein [Candidatus Obscuribacterales bacterium]